MHRPKLPDIEPEFHERLRAFAGFCERETEAGLQAGRTPGTISTLVRHIHMITDEEMRQVRASFPSLQLDCREGCDACCHRTVLATIPEFLCVLDQTANCAQEVRAAIEERAKAYRSAGDACPLLDNGRCSHYESRPSSCRAVNSVDSTPCQQWRNGGSPEVLPCLTHLDGLGEAAIFGLRAGLLWESLDHEFIDLGRALQWAFAEEKPSRRTVGADPSFGEVGLADSFISGRALPESIKVRVPEDALSKSAFVENGEPLFRSERSRREPTGHIGRDDEQSLKPYYEIALHQAEYEKAVAGLDPSRASHAMAAIVVPRTYRSASEIPVWREGFVTAMRAFREAAYPDIDKFNALSMHRTAGLAYQGQDDREIMVEHGSIMSEITRRVFPDLVEPLPTRRDFRVRRVGYLSANMHASNGCRWALGWLKRHGRDIETFALNVGTIEDGVSRQFRSAADHYFRLVRSIPENARFIKSLRLDALIITDIGLHGFNTSYATMRLAPFQCTAWGHPMTSGYPTIDAYLSSVLMEPPGAENLYSERLVLLPGSGLCYEPIEQFAPLTRSYFGLPEKGPIIVNVQTKPKLLPQHDLLYAQIAEKAKAPIVFLGGLHDGDTIVTKERMERAGVPTTWLPHLKRAEFLALLQLADVSLDPPLWSGGNTTIKALALGTPVVTLPGPWMRSRHSLAFLRQANGMGLVAKDELDYVNLASNFERQRDAMNHLEPNAMFLDDRPVKALDDILLGLQPLNR